MKKPAIVLSAGGLALVALMLVDAYGVALADETREILKMIAWSLGPLLGWYGHDLTKKEEE